MPTPVSLYQKFDKLPSGDWTRSFLWKRGQDPVGSVFNSEEQAMNFARSGQEIHPKELDEFLAEMQRLGEQLVEQAKASKAETWEEVGAGR